MRVIMRVLPCLFILATPQLAAQDIESRISGSDGLKGFTVKNGNDQVLFTIRTDGRVGIGTSTPEAPFHVLGSAVLESLDGLLVIGEHGDGELPITGMGTRMLFFPKKSAMRAGYVTGSNWDEIWIGQYSTGMGYNVKASGDQSTAFGDNTTANGTNATALGQNTTASGNSSTAMGENSTASGPRSFAAGYNVTASGQNAVAFGASSTATGKMSFVFGDNADAISEGAVAIGNNTRASGDNSYALGYYANTNGKSGAFVLSDASTTSRCNSQADNSFRARFSGGFYLFTNANSNLGVMLAAGGTSWGTLSDSTKKRDFMTADGERILSRFPSLRLGTWRYRADERIGERHYGPMAQEWFSAFGRDGRGTIGTDTVLASGDVDGVAYIAIQALEARTRDLRETVEQLRKATAEVAELRTELTYMRRAVARLNAIHSQELSSGDLHTAAGSSAPAGQ